ncbi:MAG: hypothetical protein ABT20_11115 [Rubrivivax sp. SCN 70-15]|nr:MAG: hypothetical protein ABT20_11115 [Rubrivivax sp. SCN 70-15]
MKRQLLLAAAAALLAQTLGATKIDTPPWIAAKDPFVVPGWTAGDKASWEAQIRQRTLTGQDEFLRMPARRL